MRVAARMCQEACTHKLLHLRAQLNTHANTIGFGLQVYPLESAESAHVRMQSGRNFGKIILTTTLL